MLQEEPIVIKVTDKEYSIGDQKIAVTNLSRALATELKRRQESGLSTALLIQADQSQSFDKLNPILEAASDAQLTELKFAVLPSPELNRSSLARGE